MAVPMSRTIVDLHAGHRIDRVHEPVTDPVSMRMPAVSGADVSAHRGSPAARTEPRIDGLQQVGSQTKEEEDARRCEHDGHHGRERQRQPSPDLQAHPPVLPEGDRRP